MRYFVWFLFWFFYFPLIRLATLLLFWHRGIEERELFEKKNKFEMLAHSFSEIFVQADYCFQFSSEGEFQQVLPLITDALKAGKKIELVFFSPSVEKAVMTLAGSYRSQIRYLRFPLVRIFPGLPRRSFSSWITASTLIMVRYDLFPELLLWSLGGNHKLKIVWMTFKKERTQGRGPGFWKRFFLKQSSAVVYANAEDLRMGHSMGVSGKAYDFRIEQIRRRMEKREEKFSEAFSIYPQFRGSLATFKKKVIIGNAWPSDLFLLKNLGPDVAVVIVPHRLDEETLSAFERGLQKLNRKASVIDDLTTSISFSETIIIRKKGILCELYADFDRTYVGGGFEGSIHSVLEPLVAGSQKISCGPAHHRSTEYDLCVEMGRISEVTSPESFLLWLNEPAASKDHAKMEALIKDYAEMREFVISC